MKNGENIQKRYLQHLIEEEKEELLKNADLISAFKDKFSKQGIQLEDENFRYLQTIGIVLIYPNIVSYLQYPCLTKDKEELLNFGNLCQYFERERFTNGYLYGEDLMLMAHPYFRRNLHHSNSFSPRFIELFWTLKDPKIDSYISLDFDRIRINVDASMLMELDTWYGAQFNKDINIIGDGIVKLRPPQDLIEFHISSFFSDVYSLDIKWSTKHGIKSFQAEEFKTDEVKIKKDGVEYHPVRYIHAEFDIEKGWFRHFDGALHFYTLDEYFSRRECDFNYNSKNSNHIKTNSLKLFKMNGIVSIETWITFTSHFFTGNPLVFEYFEGAYPKHIAEILDAIRLNKEKDISED